MKKFINLILICFTLYSCYAPAKKSVYLTDFRKYTDVGFVISPSSSGFSYTPIADISVEILDEKGKRLYTDKNGINFTKKDYIDTYGQDAFERDYPTATSYNIIDEIVAEAKSLGANGILNFSISRYYDESNKRHGTQANGFAVVIQE